MKVIRIGTRTSQLALWQARYVRDALLKVHKNLDVQLIEIVSEGDRTLNIPLSQAGGKGLFLKELEIGLLDGSMDLAVHSMKDVTVSLPKGLHIPVVCEREDARDAFVSNKYKSLEDMPDGAVVGTCSLRRCCQILSNYPSLKIENLRGNVNTRLAKLDNGEYDAIILAAAGLIRLKMHSRIAQAIDTNICLPAVGQGIVGIECRIDDGEINQLIAPLNNRNAEINIAAERSANVELQGGCHHPIAVYSEIKGNNIHIRGLVGELDGSKIIRSERSGDISEAALLGRQIARDMLKQGADKILRPQGMPEHNLK